MNLFLVKNNGSYAYKTVFGWCVVGPIETSKINKREINCNLMTVQRTPNLELVKHSFAVQVRVKDAGTGNSVKKLYKVDFTETKTKAILQVSQDLEEVSTKGRRFLDLMDTGTKKIGKHYQITLPLKNSTLSLPNIER